MQTGGPYQLVAGQSTPILPPLLSQTYGYAAIYNDSAFVLLVQFAGQSDFLQPNQANYYSLARSNTNLTVTPITTASNGTFIGTCRSTFFLPGDGQPVGFPLPLVPFPGGSVLVATQVLGPFSTGTIIVEPPSNTGSLIFNIGIVSGGGSCGYSVTGVQTGTIYGAITLTSNTSGAITLTGSIDTSYQVNSAALAETDVYAVSLLAIPTFPTTAAFKIGIGTSPVVMLASPNTNPSNMTAAWYLFWANPEQPSASTGVALVIYDGANLRVTITGLGYSGPFTDLQGYRTVNTVVAQTAGGTIDLTLAAAPGP